MIEVGSGSEVEVIKKYFPNLNAKQLEQFCALSDLYAEWNAKINVISRKDIDNFNERHLLHSLSVAKFVYFNSGARVLDVGTGGGFPGIPLAIMFPETEFLLVDSIGKKITVVNEVIRELGISNATGEHTRAEKAKGKFDFVVTRAVTRLDKLIPWVRQKVLSKNRHDLPNGVLALKGGDLTDELKEIRFKCRIFELSGCFDEAFFESKKLVHAHLQ